MTTSIAELWQIRHGYTHIRPIFSCLRFLESLQSNTSYITIVQQFDEIKAYNIGSDSDAYLTLIVYLDLTENKDWHDVQVSGCSEISRVCVVGKETADAGVKQCIIVPVSAERQRFTMLGIADWLKSVDACFHSKTMILAIVCEDSTIVYNEFSAGLVPPADNRHAYRKKHIASSSTASNSTQRKTPATRTVSLAEAQRYIGDRTDEL